MVAQTTSTRLRPTLVLDHGSQQQAYPLYWDTVILGRSVEADIFILHGQISRKQAVIRPLGNDRYLIIDGDGQGNPSRNGTYVNWEPIHNRVLEPGDVICLGTPAVVAFFCLLDEAEAKCQEVLQSVKQQINTGLTQPQRSWDLRESAADPVKSH